MPGLFDYEVGQQIADSDPPFSALIQAAMRKADTRNYQLLAVAFPDEARELNARYDAPGGVLDSDTRRSTT